LRQIIGVFFAIVGLAGGAFTAQLWMSPATTSPGFLGALQLEGFDVSEPGIIMLASAVLLGSTTLLRRRLTHRRSLLQVKKPKWQILRETGGNINEVI
jgi:hypothetical protein